MSANGTFLYPNVTSLPGAGGSAQAERVPKKREGEVSEFDQVLGKLQEPTKPGLGAGADLGVVKPGLKFSSHASQRLSERKINLDAAMMTKVNDAVDKAAAKGVEETLILTNDAALIVSVKNRTVITAMDRQSLSGNVFTNIDGAVII